MRFGHGISFYSFLGRFFNDRKPPAILVAGNKIMDSATARPQPSEVNDPPVNPETTTSKHGASDATTAPDTEEPPSKKVRLEDDSEKTDDRDAPRRRGVAPVKAEYVLCLDGLPNGVTILSTLLR